MALREPVAIYNAASNLEAVFVRDALIAAGIEAFVIEDVSLAGAWVEGLVPEIHKPQVWVERADISRTKPILDEFEERAAELRGGREGATPEPLIEAVCEECGGRASFPAAQRGSVQQCPHCDAYLDVGEAELSDVWSDSERGGEGDAEEKESEEA